ncbi:MAG: MBL fold metallo-hydrolase, partial [Betaproteobacteria bacterium]|nr:MBL fold metallo-hydrolase [Betaproteobacteria bacterium]
SHGTASAMPAEFWSGVRVIEVDSHARFSLGALTLCCFPVPHDAREPVQLVVESKNGRIGVLTDVGRSTPHIESMLSGVDALFIEANHDEEMLRASGYPEPLKQRIAGPYGHLSNAASAAILAAIDQSRLQHVVAAHLSQHNNRPELVQEVFGPVIQAKAQMTIASQEEGFDWVVVS